jgi:hypothetical protein
MTDQRTQHTIGQGAPVDLDEAQQLCDEATPGRLEAVALGSEGYAIRPVTGDMRKRARVAMCGYRTWAEDRANAEFFAASRSLLPRLVAELRDCRTQRDENLANVRRIDDLRIAETARLQRELDAAKADNEQLHTSEDKWEDFLGRLEAELHRIAERFSADGYPDGDVEWSIRQAGPAAALEQIAYLIGRQQDELQLLRSLAEAVENPRCVCAPPPQKVRDALAAYKQAKTGEGA